MKTGLQVAAVFGVLATMCGCGRVGNDAPDGAPVVYVDRETRQPMVLAGVDETPAVNPHTGRRTLTPGLYCPLCQTWYATPPLEVMQRNPAARRCPACQSPLTPDGPHPISGF